MKNIRFLSFFIIFTFLGCGDSDLGTTSNSCPISVKGTIVDTDGLPIFGAEIVLRDGPYIAITNDSYTAITDSNGVFEILTEITSEIYQPYLVVNFTIFKEEYVVFEFTLNPIDTYDIKIEMHKHNGKMEDLDGNIYNTIKIGNQVWMAENLRTTKYSDGTPIKYLEDSESWRLANLGAYCYNRTFEDTAQIRRYGALYNGYAVQTGKLAPDGWHIPNSTEWLELINYLIENGYNWDGITDKNMVAKSLASAVGWATRLSSSASFSGVVGYLPLQNNSSGFSATANGYCDEYGNLLQDWISSNWWVCTEEKDSLLKCGISYDRADFIGFKDVGPDPKNKGFGIRLIKNN